MKKFLKYFTFIIISFFAIPNVMYAATGSVYLSGAASLEPGKTTTLSLVANGSDNVAGLQYAIKTSGNLEIVGIEGVNGASVSQNGENVIQVVLSLDGIASGRSWASIRVRVPSNAKAGSTGSVSISNVGMSLVSTTTTLYPASTTKTITVAEPKEAEPEIVKSNDATLKSLTLKNVSDFTFESSKTSYVVNVSNDVTFLDMIAVVNDSKATYTVSGNQGFVVGRNYVTITVKAEDGTVNEYKIEVIRETMDSSECEQPEKVNKDNEALSWMIISIVLLLLLIAETGYIIYDKNILGKED